VAALESLVSLCRPSAAKVLEWGGVAEVEQVIGMFMDDPEIVELARACVTAITTSAGGPVSRGPRKSGVGPALRPSFTNVETGRLPERVSGSEPGTLNVGQGMLLSVDVWAGLQSCGVWPLANVACGVPA
jgi:hypothetical protein